MIYHDIKYIVRYMLHLDLKLTRLKTERKLTFSAQIWREKMDAITRATSKTKKKKEKEKMEARGLIIIMVEFRS